MTANEAEVANRDNRLAVRVVGPEKEKTSAMHENNRIERVTSDSLLKVGRSVRIFSVVLILLLTAGVAVIVYGQLRQSVALAQVLDNPSQLLGGFVLLMLLTVGYLVGKSWTTTRYQRRLIEQLLEEEAITRAQRLDPITQFHHPEVCRDILLRHASYSNRLHSPISLLEMTVPNLHKLSLDPQTRPLTEELIRQIRRLSRPIDSLLRWTPDSFLLVFPEVTRQELPGVGFRIRTQLEKWAEAHFDSASPAFQTRGVTSDSLGLSGDILIEVQRSLDNEQAAPASQLSATPSLGRREKSVGLTLELRVKGIDREGQPFQESVLTERVASDRIWFPLKKHLPVHSGLTISFQDGSFLETATVTRLLERGEGQLIEAQFSKTPENWVIRDS